MWSSVAGGEIGRVGPAARGRAVADSAADARRGRGRPGLRGLRPDVLGVACAGGVLGALARDGVSRAFPHSARGFPWATFGINVSGCLLIGVLMAGVEELPAHRLARPFLGVGVLGGYTTFSTQAVEAQQAVAAGAGRLALIYLAS